jgi:hypothetical protein
MKTFGELTQIELDETIAKNEYESRLIRAIRARTTGADPQALIKDLIPPDELARMIEEAKEAGSSSHLLGLTRQSGCYNSAHKIAI